MPKIILRDIVKKWDKFYGVDHLNLDIDDNAFITLLGPSGCGKTTILRMIAGLETPTSGRIQIGDKVVFDSSEGINIPANKRKVGFLFQNYALWPNMTVYENISFGLNNICEEMPVYDFEAAAVKAQIEALRKPEQLLQLTEECRNKKGGIEKDRVLLKYIDAYTMSMMTAEKLFSYQLHEAPDIKTAAEKKQAELEKKLDSIMQTHASKGERLAADFSIYQGEKQRREKRRLSKEEVEQAVRHVARVVKIGMFMDRYPAELSGGQQQRVAIARTLAPKPTVLFMDEPLSNLDAKLRLEMRYELQRLHVETGSTFVYVTHDQMEAMTLATKICLINNGVLQQYDAPLNVYNRPVNTFAADFVGNPSINFIEASGTPDASGNLTLEAFDGNSLTFIPNEKTDYEEWNRVQAEALAAAEKVRTDKSNKDELFKYHVAKVNEDDYMLSEENTVTEHDFILGIRPEYLEVSASGRLDTEIYGVMPTGMETTVKLRIGAYLLTGVMFGKNLYRIGQKEKLDIIGNDILLYSRKYGRLITAGKIRLN